MKSTSPSGKPIPEEALAARWREVALGRASEQQKIETASRTGKSKATAFIPQLRELLRDEDPEVRYYALQALVLDLKQKDSEMAGVCWRFLEEDPEKDVRSMAAACLGSIYFGSGDRRVFERLVRVMKDPRQPDYAQRGAYSALFSVAGRHPNEWPGHGVSWREPDVPIDWAKVAELEDSLDALIEPQ